MAQSAPDEHSTHSTTSKKPVTAAAGAILFDADGRRGLATRIGNEPALIEL
jgi:hypothetical protein